MRELPFSDLRPCPQCGSHKWRWGGLPSSWTRGQKPARDTVRCDECNRHERVEDVRVRTQATGAD